MQKRDVNVLDVVDIVLALNRAGQHSGKTNVAKLAMVTPPRAANLLHSACRSKLLTTYNNQYRPNITRRCYMLTERGRSIVEVMKQHDAYELMLDETFEEMGV